MRAFLSAFLLTVTVALAAGVPAPEGKPAPGDIEAAIAALAARAEKLAKFEAKRDEAAGDLAKLGEKKDELEKDLRFMNRRPIVHNNDMNKKEKEREALVDTEIPAAEARLAKEEEKVKRQEKEIDEAMARIEAFGEAAVGPVEAALADRKRYGGISSYLHEILARLVPEPEEEDRRPRRPRR